MTRTGRLERAFARRRGILLAPAAAMLAILLSGCGGAGSSGSGSSVTIQRTIGQVATTSGATAATTGTAPAETTTFTSKRFGYAIVLPGGSDSWLASMASEDWLGQVTSPNSPSLDTLTDLSTGRLYLLASLQEPAGATLDELVQLVLDARPGSCHTAASFSDSTLADATARDARFRCTDGYNVTAIAALHGHRGYFLIVASRTASPPAEHRSAVEAARRSFRFSG